MTTLCRVMEVSTSGFYEWLNPPFSKRRQENEEIGKIIEEEHKASKGAYGRRRLAEAVVQSDHPLSPSINRVERVMKKMNIQGYTPKSFKVTTIGNPLLDDSPNLVKDVEVKGIDEIWVSDISVP